MQLAESLRASEPGSLCVERGGITGSWMWLTGLNVCISYQRFHGKYASWVGVVWLAKRHFRMDT